LGLFLLLTSNSLFLIFNSPKAISYPKINQRRKDMALSRFVRQSFLLLCLSNIVACTNIAMTSEYEPIVGQYGKDVVWVPTCQVLVDEMLDMAKVTPKDFVIDLGSGDGRTVITAAKRGARALGIEYNPDMVALSKRNAAKENVGERAQFIQANIFECDFSQATVITMFLMDEINLKLRPKILNLKPGTRVVSNSFAMREWQADQIATVDDKKDCGTYVTAYLWIVPAKVEGTWILPQGELTLKQNFQMFSGTLHSGADAVTVTNGRLTGDLINFNAGNVEYTGRVSGSAMEGIYESGGITTPWKATKIEKAL
jgi:SAM-dependent methyltransferase